MQINGGSRSDYRGSVQLFKKTFRCQDIKAGLTAPFGAAAIMRVAGASQDKSDRQEGDGNKVNANRQRDVSYDRPFPAGAE